MVDKVYKIEAVISFKILNRVILGRIQRFCDKRDKVLGRILAEVAQCVFQTVFIIGNHVRNREISVQVIYGSGYRADGCGNTYDDTE